MPIESLQLNSSQLCVLDKFTGQLEIVTPSAAWSRQDVVEGAPSICFIQLKKASPTTPIFVNKSLEFTMCKEGVKMTECVLQREVSSRIDNSCAGTQHAIDVTQTLEVFHKKTCMSRRSDTGKVSWDQSRMWPRRRYRISAA
ncbi:hypothetical protein MRX96_000148 [Rhipicephalus microplus]